MNWILNIFIDAVLFIAIAGFFNEAFVISGVGAALIASAVLAVLNVLVKPLLFLFTLPLTILTMGLFLFVINAITLSITDSIMGDSFDIDGFGMTLLVSIIMSFANLIIEKMFTKKEED